MDESRVIPKFSVAGFSSQLGGRTCGSVEMERINIFVSELAGISDDTFETFDAWARTRDNLVERIAATRIDLARARADGASAKTWFRIKNTTLNLIGGGLTVLGCPTTFTGVGGIACVGGVTLSSYGVYDSLTADGFQDVADEVEKRLDELENILNSQKDVGNSVLGKRKQVFLKRFKSMCFAVEQHCL